MSDTKVVDSATELKTAIDTVLDTIDQEREREIISRRFGLFERKETLEQVGELLGITRERVRQLEKALLIRLRSMVEKGKIPQINNIEKKLIRELSEMGRVARVTYLSDKFLQHTALPTERSHVAFVAELAPHLTVVTENDTYFQAIGVKEYGDEKQIRQNVDSIVKAIKANGQPITIEQLHEKLSFEHPDHVKALASLSKQLAHLKDYWGLTKWPTVNPKNIRDKIYVVLVENDKPLHFSDIAKAIKSSDFKRKNVTTQAIHNELIKDKRFVLIGRGIYALNDWGFSKGTVTDIITEVLTKAGEPMHRDDIIKQVLDKRQVKEATILLNLQSKPQFKRVAKATYGLNTEKEA